MYQRELEKVVLERARDGKILMIVGARQVGKTTLVRDVAAKLGGSVASFNGDDPSDRDALSGKSLAQLREAVGSAGIVIVDEAHKIPGIGDALKLMVDAFGKEKVLLVTGSSTVGLLDSTSEPLTGRKWVWRMFGLTPRELFPQGMARKLPDALEGLLRFGGYPEVATLPDARLKSARLEEIASGALYRDILEFQGVRNAHVLHSLVKALALQVGNEVSYSELSKTVGVDYKTVERYVDLLEKSHVVFRLAPFARNRRHEITKMKKIYFWDTGVRNAALGDFRALGQRTDVGALFENWFVAERMKRAAYRGESTRFGFWRTHAGAEVDLVEEDADGVRGIEIKWSSDKAKAPAAWAAEKFPWDLVNRSNCASWLA